MLTFASKITNSTRDNQCASGVTWRKINAKHAAEVASTSDDAERCLRTDSRRYLLHSYARREFARVISITGI